MKIKDLSRSEAAPFYQNYIALVPADATLLEALFTGINQLEALAATVVNLKKQKFSYAAQKWTIQDVVLHLIDTERVFCYRAMCISRNDQTHFPGFDENKYVIGADANNRTFESLLEEFLTVRKATLVLFKNFTVEQLMLLCTASNNQISVRAIGFIIAGHLSHHLNVIKERYLF